ncbi:hypothetical protein TNCV_3189371 [Trichonephila clavipes]|nr:hypothetical protein TNCV_3189371 [Trichonephila clavipes]
MVCAFTGFVATKRGISLSSQTDLYVLPEGTLTGVRYQWEIFNRYIRPYAFTIGNEFIPKIDSGQLQQAVLVEVYLKDHIWNKRKR